MLSRNARILVYVTAFVACAVPALSGEGASKDSVLELKDVPKAVLDSVLSTFHDVKPVTAGSRSKHGKLVYYDVEVTRGRTKFDVYLDSDAKILSTAVAVSAKQLPSLVRDVLADKYKTWTIDEAERLTDQLTGKVSYSVDIVKNRKTLEIDLEPSGNIISEEEIAND